MTIDVAKGTLTFPDSFVFVAAMNPCPCGYHGAPGKECTCLAVVISIAGTSAASGPSSTETKVRAWPCAGATLIISNTPLVRKPS